MSHSYTIPIIHQDLRQEETLLQIACALDKLADTVNDIFTRIEKRISENKLKLEGINNRSTVVCNKINQLKGSNKSTKVFSSAKYPASSSYEDYVSIFADCQPKKIQYSYKVASKHQPLESKTVSEKLQFYHVKLGNKAQKKNLEGTPDEGLGCLPRDLSSVTSLLLFNTSENPYRRYIQIDPLGATSRTRQDLLEEQNALEAPPISISQGNELERPLADSFFYSPDLGEVPLIDVPLDLPDLPGVADDLRYNVEMGPVIAPSVSTTPCLPDLPVVSDTPTTTADSKWPQTSTSPPSSEPSVSQTQQMSTSFQVVAPSVSQVPHSPTPLLCVSSSTQPVPLTPPPPPHPPPPPPPPPPAQQTPPLVQISSPDEAISLGTTSHSSLKSLPISDPRANLMEAIRQAGGSGKANLRSAKQIRDENKKRKQEEKAGDTNFMADLHAKLSLRRKGISGANKTEASVGNAMQRVSAMIPPPQFSDSDPSAQEEGMDEDWD